MNYSPPVLPAPVFITQSMMGKNVYKKKDNDKIEENLFLGNINIYSIFLTLSYSTFFIFLNSLKIFIVVLTPS